MGGVAQGNSRGIVVYWDIRRCSCRDKYVGQHFVTMFLKEENSGFQCTFAGIYAPCDRKLRIGLWKELAAIYGLTSHSQPWVISGDFNVLDLRMRRTVMLEIQEL